MTQVKIIYYCFCLLIIGGTTAKLECGPNEMEVQCASECATDYCPTSEGPYPSCPRPAKCPQPACKCQFDYRRAENDSCIPTRKCPPFKCTRENEMYTACPSFCSDDCSHATLDGECPPTFGFIGIVLPCSPACRCVPGHWKKDGTCVPYAQCS